MKKVVLMMALLVLTAMAIHAESVPFAVLDSDNGTLTFYYGDKPTEGTVYDVPENSQANLGGDIPWLDDRTTIKHIGFDASFAAYSGLQSTAWWFYNIPFEDIDLTNFNTTNVTNMTGMFRAAGAGATLDLTKLNTSHVTDMTQMLAFNGTKVKYDCTGWDVSKVTTMYQMFVNNTALAEVAGLEDWDVSSVTNFWQFFSKCQALKPNLSKWRTSSAETMYNMFADMKAVEVFDLSNFDVSNATSLNGMFSGCNNLTEIKGIDNWNTARNQQFCFMFSNCSKLQSVDVSKWDTSSATWMNNMFVNCSALTTIDVSNFNTDKCTMLQTMFSGCSNVKVLDVANFNVSKTRNFTQMFMNCSSLESLDLSKWELTANNLSQTFSGCSKLTTIGDVSNWNTASVTTFAGTFANCSLLEKIDVSKWQTAAATAMQNMFNNCQSVGELAVGGFAVDKVANMQNMFTNCKKITSLDLSNWNTEALTNMNSMFSGCEALEELNVTSFNTENVTNMNALFSGCKSLIELDLDNFDISKVTTINNMFNNDVKLETIWCKNDWSAGTATGVNMFGGCEAIKGGFGTTFVASFVDKSWARPDTEDAPGYFTDRESHYSAIETVGTDDTDSNAPAFDVMGRKVNADYKGIVIRSGKKFVRQ